MQCADIEEGVWRKGILRTKTVSFCTAKDLSLGPLTRFWDFWTWIHLEELGMPNSYMLCLTIFEIHSCVLLVSFSYFTVSKKVTLSTCCVSHLSLWGFLLPSLPWVVSVQFLCLLWLSLGGQLVKGGCLPHWSICCTYCPLGNLFFCKGDICKMPWLYRQKYTFTLFQLNF